MTMQPDLPLNSPAFVALCREAFSRFNSRTYFTHNGNPTMVQLRLRESSRPKRSRPVVLAELPVDAIYDGVYVPDALVRVVDLHPSIRWLPSQCIRVQDALNLGASWHWRYVVNSNDGRVIRQEIAWQWPEHYFKKA